jgi:tRNA (cytidine/uridine-2'-O-)-methyltransferase
VFNIVLVEPEIPANTGNIARLCAATKSVLHLVQPLGFKLDDNSMKRAGMDYLDIAAIREHPNLQSCLPQETRSRCFFLSTKGRIPYWDVSFLDGDFLVFGRESKGLPEALLKEYPEQALTIPMAETRARSLNLSSAVGIVLYEAIRQNQHSQG